MVEKKKNKSQIIRDADQKGGSKYGPKQLAEVLNKTFPDLNFTEGFVSTVRSKARASQAKVTKTAGAEKPVKIASPKPVASSKRAAKEPVKVNSMLQSIEHYKSVAAFVDRCGGVSEAQQVLQAFASQAT